jgi:hypothetical protein
MAEIDVISRQFIVTAGEQRTRPVVFTPAVPAIAAIVARPSLAPVFGFLTVPVNELVPATVPVSRTVGSPVDGSDSSMRPPFLMPNETVSPVGSR